MTMTKLKVGDLVELTEPTVPKHLAIYTGICGGCGLVGWSMDKPVWKDPYYSFWLVENNEEVGIRHREGEWRFGSGRFEGYCEIKIL